MNKNICRIGRKISDFSISDVYESYIVGIAMGFHQWKNGVTEWATWEYNPEKKDEYYSGHYNLTYEEARQDFMYRVKYVSYNEPYEKINE